MKRIKNIAFSALLSIGAFSAVTYVACNKDECKDVVCANGGTCVSGSCSCPVGYSGTRCDSVAALKYVGNYRTTTESCSSSGANAAYNISVTVSGTNATSLLIVGLYDDTKTTTATLTANNTFTIASQAFGSSGTISGSGTLNGTQLTISYTITVGPLSDVCSNVTFVRQ